jgi:hypothetical protein
MSSLNTMPQRIIKIMSPPWERITDALAVLAVMSGVDPTMMQWLQSVSEIAALLMPPLGVAWLGVQIWVRVSKGK